MGIWRALGSLTARVSPTTPAWGYVVMLAVRTLPAVSKT
jgi:hypothetical protein